MLKLTAILVATMACTGCASTVGAFFNRPVVEDTIADKMSTVSLSADRRTVLVSHAADRKPRFCAEPPPDTASGLKTDLDASLKTKAGEEMSIKDKFETSVTVLSARNAPLDAFRTGTFSLCQLYLNGALEPADVKELFGRLIVSFETTQANVPAIVKTVSTPAAKE